MATFPNIAVSLLYHAGVTEITRTLQAIDRTPNPASCPGQNSMTTLHCSIRRVLRAHA
jgi:hypothetical protein